MKEVSSIITTAPLTDIPDNILILNQVRTNATSESTVAILQH